MNRPGGACNQEVEAVGGKAVVAIGDLSTDDGAQRVVDKAVAECGAIDILVNNAGAYEVRGWADATPQEWLDTFNQDVLSMVRMIRLLVPRMKPLGWGRIIQLSSVVGVQPLAAHPHYSAAKAAVINMTVSLAKELANSGITVNTVTPGPIMTTGWVEWARGIARLVAGATIWRRSSTASCRRSSRIRLDGWAASMTLPAPWRSSPATGPPT